MHKIVVWVQDVLVPALGAPGLFLAAFLDSSFLSLPEINDLLVVTWSASQPETAWVPILMATLGSVAGCTMLWWLGRRGGERFLVRRFGQQTVDRTRAVFLRWDLLALAIPALLPPPMPFKIFVLSAGVFGFPLRRFLITLTLARGARYLFWGLMGAVYGDEALEALRAVDVWFDARAFWLLALTCAACFSGYLFYMVRRRRAQRAAAVSAR